MGQDCCMAMSSTGNVNRSCTPSNVDQTINHTWSTLIIKYEISSPCPSFDEPNLNKYKLVTVRYVSVFDDRTVIA